MMRDIKLEDTFRHQFTTRAFATGVPTILAGTPVLSVLEENNATPITAGVTVSVDRASVVGLNEVTVIATAANGYEAGKSYGIYISTGTVGGVSVIGEVVHNFTIELQPVNWARVTAPTTAVDLSGTDIQLVDTTTTNTDQRGTDSALLAANINLSAGVVESNLLQMGGVVQSGTDLKDFADAGYDPVTNKVQGVVLVDTTTANTDMRGTDGVDTATMRGTDSAATVLAGDTAQGGTTTTIQLAAAETFGDGILEGITVKIISGTGAGQARVIISNVGATDTATIAPAWTTNPSSDSVYELVDGSVNLSVFNLGEVTGSLETSVDVADAVYDEVTSGHSTAGTYGVLHTDVLTDTGTTIPGLLPAALIGGRMDSDIGAISTSTTAADNLEEHAESIIPGTAQTGTLSVTQATTDLTGFLDDELIGRAIVWKSGTANGQASDITDYASASGLVTFTAITTAPANGDLFVIT